MKIFRCVLITGVIGMLLFSGQILQAQDRPRPDAGMPSQLEKLDLNKDGRISLDEHMAECQKRCRERFDKIDANKDGFISSEESREGQKRFRERNRKRIMDQGQGRAIP